MSGQVMILVVDADESTGGQLAAAIQEHLVDRVEVLVVPDAGAAISAARQARSVGTLVAVVFAEVDLTAPGAADRADDIVSMHHHDALAASRIVLVTARASLHGVDRALQAGAVHGMIAKPWTQHGLQRMLDAHLTTFLLEWAPELLDHFVGVLGESDRAEAAARLNEERGANPGEASATHPLLDHDTDDAAIERRFVELLDKTLGHPPRIRVAPGTTMIEAGEDVGGIYVILEGVVRLTSVAATGEHILHENSTGSVVGLLSLASHRRAMLTCKAVSDVRAIPVTLDQLGRALAGEPELSGLLNRVLVSSLARRLRRSDELQVELEQSIADLSAARAQLVSSARFATLGELSAGMAHELNNPTAALLRSMDHVVEDLSAAISDPLAAKALARQLDTAQPSSADKRALRRTLTAQLNDRQLADRLIDMGFTDIGELEDLNRLDPSELQRAEAAARLGRAVRNSLTAAERIRSLVDSLRAYSRGEDGRGPLLPGVDVAEGLDNAIRLLSHRMRAVELHRDFDPASPTLTARPGALQQVWTNLLANALDAIDEAGTIAVRLGPSAGGIRVEVEDDGPGVPPEMIDQIFEPRFTTKDGQVRFGLGLGLSISRQIVEEHGGSIRLESKPGRTVFTVDLPADAAISGEVNR